MRTVLIASEPLFRSGFRTVLESAPDLMWAGDAADARSGFQLIDREKPAVVVISLSLSGMNGIAAAREVKARAPGTRVLLIAPEAHEREVVDALAAGADGFALSNEPVEALLAAIRAVAVGLRYLPPGLRGMTERSWRGTHTPDVLAALSRREREIIDLVIRGWRSTDIARELCISVKTVETHRSHINRKLRCSSTADLVRFAADNGLIPRPIPGSEMIAGTLVLVVQAPPSMQRELRRQLEAEGYEHADTMNVMSTVAQLEAAPPSHPLMIEAHESAPAPDLYQHLAGRNAGASAPLVFAFDGPDGGQSAVRAIASFPQGEAGMKFLTLLERASAPRAARAVEHVGPVA